MSIAARLRSTHDDRRPAAAAARAGAWTSSSERGVECPGDLPAASDPDLVARARAAKEALGDRVFVLGHHYQRDEVIQFADVTGDSFKLARDAAARPGGGVHRLLRRALHGRVGRHPHRPRAAGDPARPGAPAARWPTWPGSAQVEDAWDALTERAIAESRGAGHLHELLGRHQGVLRAPRRRRVHVEQRRRGAGVGLRPARPDAKVLFFPDQHLGRNTAVLKMGMTLEDCVVWDPRQPDGGLTAAELQGARMILWKGHCSVHGRFSPDVVDDLRATIPGVNILVHPECVHEVVLKADLVGSTEFIIKTIEAAPAGTAWAIGTELNLVKRLAAQHPDKRIVVPRQDRLLLRDDEPDRPAPPGVGARVAGRRHGRQPDPGRPRDRALRQDRAPADARPAGQVPPRLRIADPPETVRRSR